MKRWTEAPHRALAVLCRGGAAVLTAFIVVACGGGDGPPEQTPALRDSMVGTATSGVALGADENAFSFSAKGTAGVQRTASGQRGVSGYEVSLTQLTGPYALTASIAVGNGDSVPYYSVATARGVANITPLTTLLVAQLYGDQPSAVFNAFGAGTLFDPSRITDANLRVAQDKVIAFVRDEIGYTVPANAGNFVTTPFRAVAGDPAYDAIAGLAQRLAATNTTIQALVTNLVLSAQQCAAEKVTVTLGSAAIDFCPTSKTAQPRDADPTLIDYRFVDRRNNRLELAIRGDSVASVTYTTAASASFTCSGAGCAGVTLGTPAGDLTRTVTFARLTLQGATGSAVLDGTLRGAIPGIALPILPCGNNRFIMVFADRSTVGRCTDPELNQLGSPGVFNDFIGVAPTRSAYEARPLVDTDPTIASIFFVTDEAGAVLAIQFRDVNPDTLEVRRRYVCKDAACLGSITSGPGTVEDTLFGPSFPYTVRTFTFADATLARVDDNGVPTGEVATLKSASFATVTFAPDPPYAYPAATSCNVGEESLAAVSDSAASFNACLQPGGWGVDPSFPDVINLNAFDANSVASIGVVVRNDQVVRIEFNESGVIPRGFTCPVACAGVTVSPPDSNGIRTVTFTNTVVNEPFFVSSEANRATLTGPRSLTLNGTLSFTLLP
jgi:hypothetical protein